MVCSAEVWAGRGPSPARKRRDLENSPPTPLHAGPSSPSEAGFSAADAAASGGGWRRPLPSSASINVRLLDAAVQVFAASFGQQVCTRSVDRGWIAFLVDAALDLEVFKSGLSGPVEGFRVCMVFL